VTGDRQENRKERSRRSILSDGTLVRTLASFSEEDGRRFAGSPALSSIPLFLAVSFSFFRFFSLASHTSLSLSLSLSLSHSPFLYFSGYSAQFFLIFARG